MRSGFGRFCIALAAFAGLPLAGCATAPVAAAMQDGAPAMPPMGWLGYCARNAGDPSCQRVSLDAAHAATLTAVAAAVRLIPRSTDLQRFGRDEYWQVADAVGGDCEDIALAARARLLAAGWPPAALRLATALTEQGERHVVLTIEVIGSRGPATLVIDSRFPRVEDWRALADFGYRFETRQAARGPGWVSVAPAAARGHAAPASPVKLAALQADRYGSVKLSAREP